LLKEESERAAIRTKIVQTIASTLPTLLARCLAPPMCAQGASANMGHAKGTV